MTDTLTFLSIFDDEGLLGLGNSSGTSLISSDSYYGSYCCQLSGSGAYVVLTDLEIGVSTAVGYYNTAGFAIKFKSGFDFNTSPLRGMFRFMESTGNSSVIMELAFLSNTLLLRDSNGSTVNSISNPFSTETWYYIEVCVLRSGTGVCTVKSNGTTLFDGETGDFQYGSTVDGMLRFFDQEPLATGETVLIDHVYVIETDSSSVERYWTKDWVWDGPYQNTAEDATDQGNTLDQNQWSTMAVTPFAGGSLAGYTVNGRAGHTRMDEGSRSGPGLGSGDYDTLLGAAWFMYGDMNGTKTPVSWRIGKYVSGTGDSYQDLTFAPDRNAFLYKKYSTSTTYVPSTTNDDFLFGMTVGSSNEVLVSDQGCYLLYIPSAGGATVVMDALTLASSPQDMTLNPGEATIISDALTLASSPQDMLLSLSYKVLADYLTLAGSSQSMSVLPGEATVLSDALTLASSPQNVSISLVTKVLADYITLVSSPQDMSIITFSTDDIALSISPLSGFDSISSGARFMVTPSPGIAYAFAITSSNNLVYKKFSGGSWGSPVTISSSGGVRNMSIYYDKWTKNVTTTKILIGWVDSSTNEVLFNALDISDDTLDGEVTAYSATSVLTTANYANTQVSIVRAESGNIYYYAMTNGGSEKYFLRSINGGTSFTTRATTGLYEAIYDYILLVPGNETDTSDIYCAYMDNYTSGGDLTLKVYDDSADSWSESASIGTFSNFIGNADWPHYAAQRHYDGHIIAVIATNKDPSTADLEVYDITNASTNTQLTNVITGSDDWYYPRIFIDQRNGDLYTLYLGKDDGSEVYAATLSVCYKKSTDGGSTWGDEQVISMTPDDFRQLASPTSIGHDGGLFMPVWYNDDTPDLYSNYYNSLNLATTLVSSLDFFIWGISGAPSVTGPQTLYMDALTLASAPQATSLVSDVTRLMDYLTLASSPQTTTVVVGGYQALMDVLILASTIENMTLIPGEAIILANELTLSGTTQNMSVMPGVYQALMNTLSLSSSPQTLSLIPGEVTIPANPLTVTSSPEDTTLIPGEAIIGANDLTLASSPQSVSLSLSTILAMDSLTLASSPQVTDIIPGAISRIMDALTLASTIENISVTSGGYQILADALSLVSSPETMSMATTYTALMDVLTMVSSPENVTFVPGEYIIQSDALTLSITPQNITIIPGSYSALMDALTLVASPEVISLVPGEYTILADALTVSSSVQSITLDLSTKVVMDVLSLISSPQGSSIIPGEAQISANVLSLNSSAQNALIFRSLVMDALSLLSSAQTASIIPGEYTIPASSLTLSSSPEGTAIVPGEYRLAADALSLASSPQSMSLSLATILGVNALNLISSVQDMSILPGEASLLMDALTLVSSPQISDILSGGTFISANALTLASSPQAANITPGEYLALMNALSIISSPQDMSLSMTSLVSANPLTLASTPQTMSLLPGGINVLADALTLASSPQNLNITVGEQIIQANALTLASTLQAMNLTPGESKILTDVLTLSTSPQSVNLIVPTTISANPLTLSSSVQNMTLNAMVSILMSDLTLSSSVENMQLIPGGATIQVLPLSLGSSVEGLSIIPGAITVQMLPATLSSSSGVMTLDVQTLIHALPLTLTTSPQILSVLPGGTTVGMNPIILTSEALGLIVVMGRVPNIMPGDVYVLSRWLEGFVGFE